VARPSEEEAIDFKPFFDMIVGVLFVLLILISAQMFFTQWASDPVTKKAQEEAQRISLEWQREISLFLARTAERARGSGLTVILDHVDRSIVIPVSEIARVDRTGEPRVEQEPIRALGEAALGELDCLRGQARAPRPGCSDYEFLRLGRMEAETRLGSKPPSSNLAPDRYAKLIATLIAASLLQQTPDLLAVTGSGSGPAFQTGSSLAASHENAEPTVLRGDFLLRFTFEEPPGARLQR
jgi:hypothetical protein